MNRDKQIEEMARVIGTVPPVEIYGGRGHGKKVFFATHIAEHLCINGYRKSTDVARNIFGNLRILGHIDFDGNMCIRKDSFEELEKEYTEGEG